MTVTYTIYTGEVHTTYASFFEKYKVPLEIKNKWIECWSPTGKYSKGWKVIFSSPARFDDSRYGKMYIVEKGANILIVNENAFMGNDLLDVNSEMREIWK
jgi:ABC-type proline/glycine betaine transport system substrate-binding protein